jgi:hypothetical protein
VGSCFTSPTGDGTIALSCRENDIVVNETD